MIVAVVVVLVVVVMVVVEVIVAEEANQNKTILLQDFDGETIYKSSSRAVSSGVNHVQS